MVWTEEIKMRWQAYTEELYKKDHYDTDIYNGVITHLESYILQCKVKWAFGSITTNKASEGNGIPPELFHDAIKVLHSICQQIWKTAVATGLEMFSFHSKSKEGQCQKMFTLPHNCTYFTCQQSNDQNPLSYASTVHGLITSRCIS